MEKKNTILLTVIAIATLLVAVVGATFAYFTANVTTSGNTDNRTATVKTYALTSATMNAGNEISATDVYPGFKTVKYVTITGTCPSGTTTCDSVEAEIVVTPNIDSAFGDDVTWTLYEGTDDSTDEVTCGGSNNPVTNGQYSANYTCTIPDALTAPEKVKIATNSDKTGEKTVPVTVTGGFAKTYYLVVEYANNEIDPQNTQQGKELSLEMKFQQANS